MIQDYFDKEKFKADQVTNEVTMDIHNMKLDQDWFKHDCNFRVETLEQYIKGESESFTKTKMQMKTELRIELAKLDGLQTRVKDDFKRLNSYVHLNTKLFKILIEDSMISQMMAEADAIDRKKIGLFGMKKNADILGTNQGAMNNNYERRSCSFQTNRNMTEESQWDMKNKDLSYKEVTG